MRDSPLTEIEIRNFKCFERLRLEGLRRVNLIGGKNNVGKTAFMEAVELFVSSSKVQDLFHAVRRMIGRRQRSSGPEYREPDFINESTLQVEMLSGDDFSTIEYIEGPIQGEPVQTKSSFGFEEEAPPVEWEPSLLFSVNANRKVVPIQSIISTGPVIAGRGYRAPLMGTNFVSSEATEERELAIFYGALVDTNKEAFLNESLRLFDKNIISLKQRVFESGVVLKVKMGSHELPVLLSSLGQGLNRYIAMLCAIWASQDGFLFIDEIENGIHYTNYDKLWKIIFQASKDANCQVFATTHSGECIQAFHEVNTLGEGAYFEFYKDVKQNKISAHMRDREQLAYALSHGRRIRGE